MRFYTSKPVTRAPAILPLIGAAMIPAVLMLALTCMSMSRAEEMARFADGVTRPPALREPPVISVTLSRRGALAIAGQPIAADAVAAAWQREGAAVRLLGFEPSQATIALRADPDLPTDAVEQLIEQAQRVGFQRCVLQDAEGHTDEVRK
jgi:biopolymer transport protein ExbD